MYRRPLFYMISLCLLLSLLCGCASMLERSYSFETVHVSADDGDSDSADLLELSDYTALREALLTLIEHHDFTQTVRLTDYSGDVERDMQRVVHDIMATPLGAFAVTNIAYQHSRILSYYEIRFDVSYRRSAQEIDGIREIQNAEELELYLQEKMAQFPTSILFHLDNYIPSRYDFGQVYQHIYYANPKLAYGFRALEAHLYPDAGTERIVELNISYTQPVSTLQAKSSTATDEAQIILDAYIGSRLTANRIKYLHDTLCSSTAFDTETAQALIGSERPHSKTDPFTVYGALIKHSAVGEGFALAFKQLCDMEEIPCQVISGKRGGLPHMWNLVQYRGIWTHVDCAADASSGDEIRHTYLGRSDAEMAETYTWEARLYPAADACLLREILALDETAETELSDEEEPDVPAFGIDTLLPEGPVTPESEIPDAAGEEAEAPPENSATEEQAPSEAPDETPDETGPDTTEDTPAYDAGETAPDQDGTISNEDSEPAAP